MRRSAPALVAVLAACAATPHQPTIAPRPFTADQIRAAMPVGTVIEFRMEQPPQPPIVMHWTVTAADARSITISTRLAAEDGTLIKDAGAETTAWSDLVKHATFPADATTMTESSVTVPAGTFESIDYVVKATAKDGRPVVRTLRFAKSLPGPPVSLVEEKDGAVIMRMTLLSRK